MVAQRQFGWGMPYTALIPFIDNFNHTDRCTNEVEYINTKLHTANNKIYMFKQELDRIPPTDEKFDEYEPVFEAESKKMKFNVSSIYNKLGLATLENEAIITGEVEDVNEDEPIFSCWLFSISFLVFDCLAVHNWEESDHPENKEQNSH